MTEESNWPQITEVSMFCRASSARDAEARAEARASIARIIFDCKALTKKQSRIQQVARLKYFESRVLGDTKQVLWPVGC